MPLTHAPMLGHLVNEIRRSDACPFAEGSPAAEAWGAYRDAVEAQRAHWQRVHALQDRVNTTWATINLDRGDMLAIAERDAAVAAIAELAKPGRELAKAREAASRRLEAAALGETLIVL
jgi:hypothetical protein